MMGPVLTNRISASSICSRPMIQFVRTGSSSSVFWGVGYQHSRFPYWLAALATVGIERSYCPFDGSVLINNVIILYTNNIGSLLYGSIAYPAYSNQFHTRYAPLCTSLFIDVEWVLKHHQTHSNTQIFCPGSCALIAMRSEGALGGIP